MNSSAESCSIEGARRFVGIQNRGVTRPDDNGKQRPFKRGDLAHRDLATDGPPVLGADALPASVVDLLSLIHI